MEKLQVFTEKNKMFDNEIISVSVLEMLECQETENKKSFISKTHVNLTFTCSNKRNR